MTGKEPENISETGELDVEHNEDGGKGLFKEMKGHLLKICVKEVGIEE